MDLVTNELASKSCEPGWALRLPTVHWLTALALHRTVLQRQKLLSALCAGDQAAHPLHQLWFDPWGLPIQKAYFAKPR